MSALFNCLRWCRLHDAETGEVNVALGKILDNTPTPPAAVAAVEKVAAAHLTATATTAAQTQNEKTVKADVLVPKVYTQSFNDPILLEFIAAVTANALEEYDAELKLQHVHKEAAFGSPSMPGWKEFVLDPREALKIGVANAVKAVFDALQRNPRDHEVLAALSQAFPGKKLMGLSTLKPIEGGRKALDIQFEYCENMGRRKVMEDFGFALTGSKSKYSELFSHIKVFGVFDGHGGKETANKSNEFLKEHFFEYLYKAQGNIYLALQLVFHELASQVKNYWAGAVSSIAVIDANSHLMYSLALGDCEISFYPAIWTKTQCVAASILCDWATPEDAERATNMGYPPVQTFPQDPAPYNLVSDNLTNSRSLGDNKNGVRVTISRPEISIMRLVPGKVIVTTDGLQCTPGYHSITMDYIKKFTFNDIFVRKLVDRAKNARNSDNLFIIAIDVDYKK